MSTTKTQSLSVRRAISEVKSLIQEINIDSRFTNKEVYGLIMKHLTWLLKQESEILKLYRLDEAFNTLSCIPIEAVPVIDDCAGLRKFVKCTIYRTRDKLPEIFENNLGPIIKFAGSLDGHTELRIMSQKEFKRQVNRKYNKYVKTIAAIYHNRYLYFPDGKLDYIKVEALFKEEITDNNNLCDPCKDCDKNCIKFLDTSLPMSPHLWARVVEAIKTDLNLQVQVPEKTHNINKNTNS